MGRGAASPLLAAKVSVADPALVAGLQEGQPTGLPVISTNQSVPLFVYFKGNGGGGSRASPFSPI